MFIILLIGAPVFSPAQNIINEFDAPGHMSKGLAWDGHYLWCADAATDSIFKIDPVSGQVLHAIPFTFHTTLGGGITWSGDEALWVAWTSGFWKLDASTGQKITYLDCPG